MPFLETAVEIAREAGALVANYHQRHIPFETKGEFDLVTEADRSSEKLIVERLRSHFPAHAIVAEEGGGHESASEYRWFIDPLDGTTNFAHGFPMFCISMGPVSYTHLDVYKRQPLGSTHMNIGGKRFFSINLTLRTGTQ